MEFKIQTLQLMHLGSSYYALKHVYIEYTSRSSRVCSLVQGSSNGALTSRINIKSYDSSVPNIFCIVDEAAIDKEGPKV